MTEIQVMLQHGWAIAPSMWQKWMPLIHSLAPRVTTLISDRGYAAAETNVSFAQRDSLNILVAHSLGLHIVSPPQIQASDLLVIIGGFFHFHNGTEKQTRLSKLAIRKMFQKLDSEPDSLLSHFYENCGFSADFVDELGSNPIHIDRVKADLLLLNESVLNVKGLTTNPPQVLILHGKLDEIVPEHHAHELNFLFPGSKLYLHPSQGHALPHNDPRWCLKIIQEQIKTNLASGRFAAKAQCRERAYASRQSDGQRP